MTRYAKYMQHIHNQAAASSIETAVNFLTEDIIDLLVKSGVKPHGELLNKIRELQKYEYGKTSFITYESRPSK